MPRLSWNDIEESGGGEYARVTPGGYVVAFQKLVHRPESEYVMALYDIVEGEFAGKYSDEFWTDKEYAHRVFLSYKPKAQGMLKQRLRAVTESNPGFDAFAAFDADNWAMFVGRKFGLVLGEEEYVGADGTVKTRLTDVAWKTAQQIREGDYKTPVTKRLPDGQRPAGAAPADLYEDVPF